LPSAILINILVAAVAGPGNLNRGSPSGSRPLAHCHRSRVEKADSSARAPVNKENIETEFRTASGVTDGRGKFIAGVVMITAGYSAEGKYSHFFITQAPLKIGSMMLANRASMFLVISE